VIVGVSVWGELKLDTHEQHQRQWEMTKERTNKKWWKLQQAITRALKIKNKKLKTP